MIIRDTWRRIRDAVVTDDPNPELRPLRGTNTPIGHLATVDADAVAAAGASPEGVALGRAMETFGTYVVDQPDALALQAAVNEAHKRQRAVQAGAYPGGVHVMGWSPVDGAPVPAPSAADVARDQALGALASLEDLALDSTLMFSQVEDVRRLAQTVRRAL